MIRIAASIFIVLLVAGTGALLWHVLPLHAWATWDGRRWRPEASGWPLLWQAWPAVLAGAAAALLAVSGPLWWFARRVAETAGKAAVEAKIGRLQERWGIALAKVEERARGREEAATRREELASQIRQAAEQAWREAEAAKLQAERAKQEAEIRVRNAVAAAERTKRKAKQNISALAGGPKPARNSPPEPPR